MINGLAAQPVPPLLVVDAGRKVTVGTPQLSASSEMTAVFGGGTSAPHWKLEDTGLAVGFSVSFTVTVNVQVAVPQLFVAVTVTVVVPTGKELPDGVE